MQAAGDTEAIAESRLHASVRTSFESCLVNGHASSGEFPIALENEEPLVRLVIDADDGRSGAPTARDDSPEYRVLTGANAAIGDRDDHAARAACASAWVLQRAGTLEALVDRARKADCGHMLPATCLVEENPRALIAAATAAVARQLLWIRRRRQVAERERLLCRLANRSPGVRDPSLPLLSIVISTFNRARFVRENVRWLLGVLSSFAEDISLDVVDNASTDDTLERLAEFAGDQRVTVISNPVNVGMLGNLRICSGLILSRHVWITGDDDFILPSGLAEVVDALRRHPEIPFVFVNFGIYHRTHFGPNDTVRKLVAERTPLAVDPCPSGVYPIVRIAEQHDNLFTAFYPIVFRSDLLAACFNHPFDGKPFDNLVESVPTSKMLLETYGATHAYWCARMGIVGNVANSWSRHRPRWHAVLMPRVLQLARDAGADPARLQQWSAVHFELFLEARRRARADGVPIDIFPDELDAGYRVFRQPIPLA
jgi:hypothetical protein